jgi:predicted dehydrogenase
MATHLATSGISMLIEKPLSLDMDGIEQLREFIRARALVVAVGYVLRANPPLKAMRDAIRRGRFGQPREIIAVSGQHFPTYRPAYRDTYYARRGSGGGAIQDAFTHIINLGEWLVGPISRLVADASHQVLQDVEVEDTVHVLARHHRVLGCYSLNQFQTPNENSITVVCDKGTVRWEGHLNRWEWQTSEVEDWQRQESGPFDRDQLFITQAHRFLDAMEGRSDPLCTLDEGVQTLRTNLAILASVEQASWQELTAICCGGNHAGA